MNMYGENIQFWDRIAKRYDWITSKLTKDYSALIQRIANEIDGAENVLEVATGSGLIAIELARKAKMIEAVDISSEMIELSKNKASENQIENIHFSVQNAYNLDFEGGTFDAAICSNALHCMETPQQALLEIRRVLKPKGILIAPTFCHGANWRSRLISGLMSLTGFKSYHRFTIEEFSGLIVSSGFAIIRNDISKDFIPLAYVVAQPAPVCD
jgi:phosphatidylethanolamine/phosphatidyl-N-methylethanolamine N-methyltransferase